MTSNESEIIIDNTSTSYPPQTTDLHIITLKKTVNIVLNIHRNGVITFM